MDAKKLSKIAIKALEDVKGKNITTLNVTHLTSLCEMMIIASGDSNRQVRALADHVRDKIKEAGGEIIGTEGEEGAEWVLVDAGDIVVHVMHPVTRELYNLEELWGVATRLRSLGKPPAAEDGATKRRK